MKQLDDIPKTNIFEVPEGYFDRLPMKIQARVEVSAQTRSISVWNLSLRYALPVIVAGFALFYYVSPKTYKAEELLAGISNDHLIAFLNESDVSEGDLLEVANFNDADADSLNQQLNNSLLEEFNENEFNELEKEL
jgi:hypothetical protein